MPNLFSIFSQNQTRATLQSFNAITGILAAYNLMTNPEASIAEDGMAIATCLCSTITLRDDPDVLEEVASYALNWMRLGAIYSGVTSGSTSWMLAMNLVDSLERMATPTVQIFTREDNPLKEPNDEQPKLS